MTKQEIMDNYANELGYENWDYLTFEISAFFLKEHINSVIDLIQEELKKKIHEKVMNNDISFVIDDEGILNTPNL